MRTMNCYDDTESSEHQYSYFGTLCCDGYTSHKIREVVVGEYSNKHLLRCFACMRLVQQFVQYTQSEVLATGW